MTVNIEKRWSNKYGEHLYFVTKPSFTKTLILTAAELAQLAEYAKESATHPTRETRHDEEPRTA